MRLPKIAGLIRRRLLINFRADPKIVRALLPSSFAPKLHMDQAMVGICLIRLEQIRPHGLPKILGVSSENAAHRIAVIYNSEGQLKEGVFIARRDTASFITHVGGGRIFPGEHHFSNFEVNDNNETIELNIKSKDLSVSVRACTSEYLSSSSSFRSLDEASKFFEKGSVGYSVTHDPSRLDGLNLVTKQWSVQPLEVTKAESSYFMNPGLFPKGSIEFDCGLIMRDVEHEWHSVPDFHTTNAS